MELQGRLETLKREGIAVAALSYDPVDVLADFGARRRITFPLLSDPEHKLADFFGVYGEREWQGKKYMGLARDTFLVDPQGKVVRAFRGVNPVTTSEETYEAVKALTQPS